VNIRERNELHIAYLKTEYSIELPEGRIWISPLSANEELRSLLLRRSVNNWALITPYNPASQILSDRENEDRLDNFEIEALTESRRSKGVDYFDSVSKPEEVGLTGECGFWIANIFPWEAIRLGYKWGQNAILIGRADGLAKLQWCNHESQIFFDEPSD
jgi:hypothetical protein